MKYLSLVVFVALNFITYSQPEKGLTVKDWFTYGYTDYSTLNHFFSELQTQNPNYSNKDTFDISMVQGKSILIKWDFLNETTFYHYEYDSVEWYFNDTLLNPHAYSFEINDDYAHRVYSKINNPKVGFYQLRRVGEDGNMLNTNYPVIHVAEEEKDSVEAPNNLEFNILYPNPAEHTIHLELKQPIKNGDLKIYNLHGKLVRTFLLNSEEMHLKFDISDLNQGVYLFSIINYVDSSKINHKKIVIQ